MKTLGFIGTGGMGSGMAANLIKAGYRLVIHDLRREQSKSLESQGLWDQVEEVPVKPCLEVPGRRASSRQTRSPSRPR